MGAKFEPIGELREQGQWTVQAEQRGSRIRFRITNTVTQATFLTDVDGLFDLTEMLDDMCDEWEDGL